MISQAEVAASQPAEVADVFNGEQPSLAEFSQYRETGEIPERFKPADTADSATAQESTEGDEPESEPESDPDKQQEKKGKGKTAEDRIAQLEATIDKIKRGAGLERKTESAPVTEQPQAAPQNYVEWQKAFDPEKWMEEFGKKNPEATYERANVALFDYMLDARDRFASLAKARQSQAEELTAKVADARARYGEKFDEVLQPTLNAIVADKGINPNVKAMINDSDVIADLIFTLGSDEKTLDDFVALAKTHPGKALRYIAVVENGIIEELATQGKETDRDDKGQFKAAEPPAKTKTGAPRPPAPVSGASSGAFDVSDESLSPDEWMRKRNEQLAKRKG